MAFVGNNLKVNTATLVPQSAQPSNPTEGMIYYDNGTTNTEGVYKYQNAAWEFIGSLVDHLKLNPLSADPTSPIEGQVFYSDGTTRSEGLHVYKNGAWAPVGASSGSLDIFYQQDFETDIDSSDLRTGNNSTFLGGGTLQGSVANETVAPISGVQSISYTQAAGSANDYFALPTGQIELDEKQQSREVKITLYTKYDGDDDDVRVVIYDETNTAELGSFNVKASSIPKRSEFRFFVLSSTNEISVGVQTNVENSGSELIIDDIEITTDSSKSNSIVTEQELHLNTGNGHGSTNTAIRRFSTIVNQDDENIFSYVDDATDGMSITANQSCVMNISYTELEPSGDTIFGISKNSTQLTTSINTITAADRLASGYVAADGTQNNCSVEVRLVAGDVIRAHTNGNAGNTAISQFVVSAKAFNEGVITSSEIPVNIFNAEIANNGTASITDQGPNNFIASVNRSAAGTVDITFTTDFFSEAPYIQVSAEGTGIGADTPDYRNLSATGVTVLVEDQAGSNVDQDFMITATNRGVDRKDLTANLIQTVPRIAYASHTETSGTAGGTSAVSYTTRTINSTSGDTSFLSLSSNQITLGSGEYDIDGFAVARLSNGHRSKLYNVTDATDAILGSTGYTDASGSAGNGSNNASFIRGKLTLTSPKVFEVRTIVGSAKATDGLGQAGTLGDQEKYLDIKITKLK